MAELMYQSKKQENQSTWVSQRGVALQDNRAGPAPGKVLADARHASGLASVQCKNIAHPAGCSCCGNQNPLQSMPTGAAPAEPGEVAQRTCDAGHKQHKNGPCPQSAAGKVNRMAGTHHKKTGVKGTPKKRLAKWAAQNLKDAEARKGPPPPPPPPPGAGGIAV